MLGLCIRLERSCRIVITMMRDPTVTENDSGTIQIFSGKVVNSVSTAKDVTKISWRKILGQI